MTHKKHNHQLSVVNCQLALALAVLMTASCQNEDLTTTQDVADRPSKQVVFSMSMPSHTRAAAAFTGKEAAEKLGNHFLVQGFKYFGQEPTSYADIHNPEKEQEVFDYYNVNYEDGTANTTSSNTADWEYVGYLSQAGDDQTIKYWDYDATGYVFSAISGTGVIGEKIEATSALIPETVYEKGWNITIPAGGSLTDLYASARTPLVKPASGSEYETVKLTFYSLATKIRFAVYETVPGYSVSIDRFYYNDGSQWQKSTTNFAVTGDFRVLNNDKVTNLKVTYYDAESDIENRPKLSCLKSDVTTEAFKLFGSNIQSQSAIGTNSTEATYDQAGQAYTYILPYQSDDNVLTLYVDYTLTAKNGETIHVKHASARVPNGYLQWKENFAYTYLFKISDKSNGTTGESDDPDDPTSDPTDPAGLYPITFDACVVNSEEGIQETITSVSEPSITTYQQGVVVTDNDEYEAGDIYYNVMREHTLITDISERAKVFEVNNYGTEATTEAVLGNYTHNFVVLTPVAVTEATQVPKSDGTYLTFTEKTCYKFAARAGKVYAIQYSGIDQSLRPCVTYKVVKVVGSDTAAPAYTLTGTAQTIKNHLATASFTLQNTNGADQQHLGVLGASPLLTVKDAAGDDVTDMFEISEGADGLYTVALTNTAVNTGADGTYRLCFRGTTMATNSFVVDLGYTLTPSNVTVVAGGTGTSTLLTIDSPASSLAGAVVSGVPDGLSVTDTGDGNYAVSATDAVAYGRYSATIAGKTLTINVDRYQFASKQMTVTKEHNKNSQFTVILTRNGLNADVAYTALDNSDATVASYVSGTGAYKLAAEKGGQFTLRYENASCDITVNAYALTADQTTVQRSSGKAVLSLALNGTAIGARTTNVTCIDKPADSSYSLVTTGKHLTFSNATKAGDYRFQYKTDGVVVAEITIKVNE